MKRYYTSEQQADLDIKTSVNKIGEIVNLSQVLNSLYWDRINHGQSHKENFELFRDICTLNVLSGLEIDAAKKEFSINRTNELKHIRNKYKEVLTEDKTGKTIRPKFFVHILKASGKSQYLGTDNKSYLKHETAMDYLQEISRSYYRPENSSPMNYPFEMLLNKALYHRNQVYEPSITKTVQILQNYLNELSVIGSISDISYQEKSNLRIQAHNKRNRELDCIKYSYSTMYKLLAMTDDITFKGFSNVLLLSLFEIRHRDFYNILVQSEEPLSILTEDVDGDIDLYGYRFKKVIRDR